MSMPIFKMTLVQEVLCSVYVRADSREKLEQFIENNDADEIAETIEDEIGEFDNTSDGSFEVIDLEDAEEGKLSTMVLSGDVLIGDDVL